jgi:hypothetical protein
MILNRAPDNAEAWRFLGQAQAENEEETQYDLDTNR